MRLDILAEAAADIKEITNWYKDISQLLAVRFVAQLYNGFEKITSNPDAFFNLSKRVKRYHLADFPYLILFFKRDSETVVVFAVIHERRSPREWKRRMMNK
ncbi:MAG TPA: type II toxin-antitoxin system RelE/ParE family toxin [Chitinophagaceae bacterium]